MSVENNNGPKIYLNKSYRWERNEKESFWLKGLKAHSWWIVTVGINFMLKEYKNHFILLISKRQKLSNRIRVYLYAPVVMKKDFHFYPTCKKWREVEFLSHYLNSLANVSKWKQEFWVRSRRVRWMKFHFCPFTSFVHYLQL